MIHASIKSIPPGFRRRKGSRCCEPGVIIESRLQVRSRLDAVALFPLSLIPAKVVDQCKDVRINSSCFHVLEATFAKCIYAKSHVRGRPAGTHASLFAP
nr:hypothetical protein CFP56_41414 [Quercus suber]